MSLDILGPASALNSVTTRPAQATTYGATRTWFKNCTSLTTQDGTELTNDWLNNMLAQARTLFDGAGIVEDNGDDMLYRAVQSLGVRFGSDSSSTADALVVTFSPPITAYSTPLTLAVVVANDCDGNACTINANAIGNKAIIDEAGNAPKPQAMKAGGIAFLEYNGTAFQLINPYSPKAPGTPSTTKAPKLIGVSATGNVTALPNDVSTVMDYNTTVANNMWGTSTFNGTTITVGAGEAGIWLVQCQFDFPSSDGLGEAYLQGGILVNGSIDDGNGVSVGGSSTGTSNGCLTVGMVKANVGDQIQTVGFQQNPNGVSSATPTAMLQGFLISAF